MTVHLIRRDYPFRVLESFGVSSEPALFRGLRLFPFQLSPPGHCFSVTVASVKPDLAIMLRVEYVCGVKDQTTSTTTVICT